MKVYYMDSEGIARRGELLEEIQGEYLGKYLLVKNSFTKKEEGIFPYDIIKEDLWKQNKNKRINRGRRWKNSSKKTK